ncbi:helix-turn-helix domain-containing protein [Mesorhizobium sp. M2E.F.Ca.ET.166.01.1.1]|nr:helix-turn-helix domain-containing protein [Mesorhizobium sp. M2E.F.Ca.ET.219.01.1.1]TGT64263.1 helix-turn-helix domain-containing protein [Mesorhizobium sp. M2E.F.Ca.ET.166.01.1.1]TGV97211.1 helix-turn-helix domain-containing protein [Mesorhizobium sp. M2E.F.Ca.ET.154.01.1.1]
MITRQQIRTPRTMLGWTQNELAQAAEISGMAVRNIESGATADPRPSTVAGASTSSGPAARNSLERR